jgi:hypothetical protein
MDLDGEKVKQNSRKFITYGIMNGEQEEIVARLAKEYKLSKRAVREIISAHFALLKLTRYERKDDLENGFPTIILPYLGKFAPRTRGTTPEKWLISKRKHEDMYRNKSDE